VIQAARRRSSRNIVVTTTFAGIQSVNCVTEQLKYYSDGEKRAGRCYGTTPPGNRHCQSGEDVCEEEIDGAANLEQNRSRACASRVQIPG
jgi:hypothetical protein